MEPRIFRYKNENIIFFNFEVEKINEKNKM